MSIEKIKRNSMGTVAFEGKFLGMRKPQEFITYPIGKGDDKAKVKVQSDTRIGYIHLESGHVHLSASIKSGAYNHHLGYLNHAGKLRADELFSLKAQLLDSASPKAGSNGVITCDNSGAAQVFDQQAKTQAVASVAQTQDLLNRVLKRLWSSS